MVLVELVDRIKRTFDDLDRHFVQCLARHLVKNELVNQLCVLEGEDFEFAVGLEIAIVQERQKERQRQAEERQRYAREDRIVSILHQCEGCNLCSCESLTLGDESSLPQNIWNAQCSTCGHLSHDHSGCTKRIAELRSAEGSAETVYSASGLNADRFSDFFGDILLGDDTEGGSVSIQDLTEPPFEEFNNLLNLDSDVDFFNNLRKLFATCNQEKKGGPLSAVPRYSMPLPGANIAWSSGHSYHGGELLR
eukprot:Rmarinus@m.26903